MTDSVLLVIDAQQSFYQRGYAESAYAPAFEQALNQLITGCQQKNVPIVDVFHIEYDGPFSLDSGLVRRLPFLQHRAALSVQKRVHNALTDSGLHQWLQQQGIRHVIISGIRSEQCCETTARVASDLGYQVSYITEATMTFPMQHKGITLNEDEIKHRTECMLINRFAAIRRVEQCLQELS